MKIFLSTGILIGASILAFGSGRVAYALPQINPANKPVLLQELKAVVEETLIVTGVHGQDAVAGRCSRWYGVNECSQVNEMAIKYGLLDKAGYNYLKATGFYVQIGISLDGELEIVGVCPCGCFEASTQIFAKSGGFEQWVKAQDILSKVDKIFALEESATLFHVKSNPKSVMTPKDIEIKTAGEEKLPLFVFTLSNGQVLKVTENHGMILNSGHVVPAKEVQEKQSFLSVETGEDVSVKKIHREYTKDLVYNFRVGGEKPTGSVIAAEGVLVGSLFLQAPENREEASGIAIRQ